MVTNPGRIGSAPRGTGSLLRRIRRLPRRGERRPVAMTPYAITVALFAAFVSAASWPRPCRCGWSL